MIKDIREVWEAKMDEQGLKFFVLKSEDLFKLSEDMVKEFNAILYSIENNRAEQGKSANNKYWVVNRDEEFAPKVKKMIEDSKGIELQD